MTLGELGGRVNETISLSLRSTDPIAFPIRIKSIRPEDLMPLPDVITVRIHTSDSHLFFFLILININPLKLIDVCKLGNAPTRDLVVEIENQSVRPPFMGGWRKKATGLCFYHAQTQTDYSVGPDDKVHIVVTGKLSPVLNKVFTSRRLNSRAI